MTYTRSRPAKQSQMSRQTAEGNGCLSGFLLPPLAALFVSVIMIVVIGGLGKGTAAPAVPAIPIQNASLPIVGSGELSALFTPEIQFWAASLKRWSAANGVDVNLAATVMQIESCGNPDARSSSGAMGLFQVMPFHFQASENGYDTETNALRGLDYLRRSVERANGDARLALAGYNGGIGVIGWAESSWPSETKRYVYWGAMYNDAVQNATTSTRLDEWKTATGNSLCIQASQRLGINR
jgi:hypothetical protein